MVGLDLITFIRFRELTNDLAPSSLDFTFICGATALDRLDHYLTAILTSC
jgi:hypothetical protein